MSLRTTLQKALVASTILVGAEAQATATPVQTPAASIQNNIKDNNRIEPLIASNGREIFESAVFNVVLPGFLVTALSSLIFSIITTSAEVEKEKKKLQEKLKIETEKLLGREFTAEEKVRFNHFTEQVFNLFLSERTKEQWDKLGKP